MNCHECRDALRGFLEGSVESDVRKRVALHLSECTDCMSLVENDGFWEQGIVELLNKEAPADLRQEILGDLATPRYSDLDRRQKLKIMGWAARRNPPGVWDWIKMALIMAAVYLLVQYWPF